MSPILRKDHKNSFFELSNEEEKLVSGANFWSEVEAGAAAGAASGAVLGAIGEGIGAVPAAMIGALGGAVGGSTRYLVGRLNQKEV